jgi:serine/threonine protein kinase
MILSFFCLFKYCLFFLFIYLVKAVSKDLVTRLKKISQVFREKDILARLTDCTYAVKLYCTFQDEKTLCKYLNFYYYFIL